VPFDHGTSHAIDKKIGRWTGPVCFDQGMGNDVQSIMIKEWTVLTRQ